MAGLCPAFSFVEKKNGRSSGTAVFIELRPSSVNRFPGGKQITTNFSAACNVHDCSAKGSNQMENLFLTTLLISVVIGVLVIYHVTPEG